MKTQNLQLQIPKPCHEKWESMTTNEKGAHCRVCATTVVDFTKMSKRELIAYFDNKAKGEKTCGRFTKFQLNRELTFTSPKPTFYQSFKKLILACFMGLSLPAFVKAEKTTSPITQHQTDKNIEVSSNNELPTDTIKGKLIDEYGESLLFANVYIKHTKIGCISDIDGFFKLPLTDSLQNEKEITLVVKYIGYEDYELTIDKTNASEFHQIALPESEIHITMGMVIPYRPEKKRPKWKYYGYHSKKAYRQAKKNNEI